MSKALARRLAVLSALVCPLAWAGGAATAEVEPNNSCAAAQDLGAIGTATVSGTIDTSDVDFFTLKVAPGSLLQINMRGAPSGAGTLPNMLMGLLDADCAVQQYSDNSENGFEAKLVLVVPSDGIVRFAAAGNPDFAFTGTNTDTGTYTLSIGAPTGPVIGLSGRLTDATTGQPLTRDQFAVVNLMSCPSASYGICTTYMAQGIPDAQGRYTIAQAVPPGAYQIRVRADNHTAYNSAPFTVTGPRDPSVRDYALPPLPVVVSDVAPCQSMTAGGTCTYSYRLTNTTASPVQASVWSQIDQGPSGSPMFASRYSLGTPSHAPLTVTLAPGASREVQQSIPLRGAPAGSSGFVYLYAATRGNQTDTIGYGYGFNYTVTAADQAVKAVRTALPMRPTVTRQLRRAARDVVAPSAGPQLIAGVALDPVTRQPITDGSVSVQLQACQDPSHDLCMGTVGLFTVDANGRYAHSARRLSPGRYQLWAFRQDDTTYGLNYSRPFDFDGSTALVNVVAAKAPLKYGPVQPCARALALPVGTDCTATYELSNVTSSALTVDLWAVISTSETGSAQGFSQYDVGIDGTGQHRSVTIAPGATVKVAHRVPVGHQLPSGTYANMEFFASVPGKPAQTLGNARGFDINVVP
jgi:hypothetical protein